LKIKNDDLIAKIYQYEDALELMNSMQKKLQKYELEGIKKEFAEEENKDNEIIILRAENKILKNSINDLENDIKKMSYNFERYKKDCDTKSKKQKSIIDNLKMDLYMTANKNSNNLNINNSFDIKSLKEKRNNFISNSDKKNKKISEKNLKNVKSINNNGVYKISYSNLSSNLNNNNKTTNNETEKDGNIYFSKVNNNKNINNSNIMSLKNKNTNNNNTKDINNLNLNSNDNSNYNYNYNNQYNKIDIDKQKVEKLNQPKMKIKGEEDTIDAKKNKTNKVLIKYLQISSDQIIIIIKKMKLIKNTL
jgi:hypothetical protein